MAPTQSTSRRFAVSRLGRGFVLLIATWCATRDAPGNLFATAAQKQVDLPQLNAADLEELKSMKSNLEEKLRSIRLPAPTSVMAFGKQHPVPSTVEDPEEPSPDMLQYLSGHFAGSGSISSTEARLRVSESGPDASNLFLFQKYFGGSVYVNAPGSGLKRPRIVWSVKGDNALRAARMMSKSKLQKQKQLSDVAEGRLGIEDGDAQGKEAFQHWSEVAGFLDARMVLEATASRIVKLSVYSSQKKVLEALAEFFQGHIGTEVSVPHCAGGHNKGQHGLHAFGEDVTLILSASLESGLLIKREGAEAILRWTPETHWEVREKLRGSKGFHGRFCCLDEKGAARAREIQKLQGQLRRKQAKGADADEIVPLKEQLAELVLKHKRLQLVDEIQGLQDHLETVQGGVATAAATKGRV